MTDMVIPSINGDSDAYAVAQLAKVGSKSDGWIQESSTALVADNHSSISNTPLNAFNESHSSSSFDVTIDTGEGFVGGAWIARDTTTTVTLSSSTNNQTVYVGWDIDATETVIIGKSGDFASDDEKIAIWDFDTDGSGVTSSTDKRSIGETTDLGQTNLSADSELKRFLKTAVSATANGTAGNSTNEVHRTPGASSDLIMSVSADGKYNIAYNAYYDGSNWNYMVGSEPAMRVQFADGIKLHTSTGGTADNTISFDTYHFDDDNGDLIAPNGNTIWDDSAGNVPQSNLGGPASDFSAHPIQTSDIDGSQGSNGNVLTTDGTTDGVTWDPTSGNKWTHIKTIQDTDDTTQLDLATGTLSTTYDEYRIFFYWENYTGEVEAANMRINGNGQTVYQTGYSNLEANTMGVFDEDQFRNIATIPNNSAAGAVMTIQSKKSLISSGADRNLHVHCNSTAPSDRRQMQRGEMKDSVGEVTSIDIFDNTGNAVGIARYEGRNL